MSKVPTAAGLPSVPILTGTAPEDPLEAIRPPEALPWDRPRPKKASEYHPQPPPSRLSLRLSANWWRSLQYIGMSLHFLAPPRPPNPTFVKTIPSTLSARKGEFRLHFYTPQHYQDKETRRSGRRFPCVVNFHGGGFTLGNGTDDARFARVVMETCGALFVSVDYRLAPEYPFPTAVEDGVDALLYLVRHAEELRIDTSRLATSGFSAGANLALTVPLRLRAFLDERQGMAVSERVKPNASSKRPGRDQEQVPEHRIIAVMTWYPVTDYTITRAERRATSRRPGHTLPPAMTNIFDAAYLYPSELDLADPYLSPSQGSDEVLRKGIPPHVIFYTCEWDMLLREGEDLARRLAKPPLNKDVRYKMIERVAHGWDKGPDPRKPAERSEELYQECCNHLKEIFEALLS